MILAATGHRPPKLDGYGTNAQNRLIGFARRALQHLRPDEVIIGMAQGWDQAVGWACYHEGIPFRAYVPFAGQESQWPAASQRAYSDLLFVATSTHICTTGGYDPAAMQVRNMDMVNDSDAMLALWDGSPGGTFNCIDYARNRKAAPTPVINTWKAWIS